MIDALNNELLNREFLYPWSDFLTYKYGKTETTIYLDKYWKLFFPLWNFTITINRSNNVISKIEMGRVI